MIPELLAPCSELALLPPERRAQRRGGGWGLSRPTSTGLLDAETKEQHEQ